MSLFLAQQAIAAQDEEWTVSTFVGYHHPKMSTLSEGLYLSPLIGKAPARQEESGTVATVEYRIDADLPEVGKGAKAGVEFQWRPLDSRHSFVFGAGSFEKTSITVIEGGMPIQDIIRPVQMERRGKLSYTEYYLGLRTSLVAKEKYSLYSRLVLHQIFDVDYREDMAFFFPFFDTGDTGIPNRSDSFSRVIVMEAQTAALLLGEVGFGGDYYLEKWVSLGFELGLFLGPSDTRIGNIKTRTSFQEQDNFSASDRSLPFGTVSGDKLGYLPADSQASDIGKSGLYRPVGLDFNGWQILARLSIRF